MTYKVGSFATQCKYSARAKAEETKTAVQYVVVDQAFADYDKAATFLTGQLESRAAEMRTVRFVAGKKCVGCPKMAAALDKSTGTTVKYRVGGFDFDTREEAARAAKKLDSALASVSMKYEVDGKEVGCCASAKKAGKKITYVVGDEKTDCETQAKLMLAEHMIKTIVDTVASASAERVGA